MATVTEALATLFGAYGAAKDVDRIKIYTKALGLLPPALVEKAVLKTMLEWHYMYPPPVGVIVKNAESLNASVNEAARVKTWEEAWGEIDKAMYSTPWEKTPQWSTPQIAAAVNAYGWKTLQSSLAADMPTVRAQVRRLYEDACSRISSQARNEFLLGKNPQGVLGIPAVTDLAKQLGVGK